MKLTKHSAAPYKEFSWAADSTGESARSDLTNLCEVEVLNILRHI